MIYRDDDGTVTLSLMAITGRKNCDIRMGMRGGLFSFVWFVLWASAFIISFYVSNEIKKSEGMETLGSVFSSLIGVGIIVTGIMLAIFW
jgi:hypothetical protein